jgi:hypothetical protein
VSGAEHEHPATGPDGGCGDAAIYLLGLLDEQHAARFRAHAETCAICRDELGALRPAVDVLPASVPQLDAPAHVKRDVMAVVHAEAARQASSTARAPGASRAETSRARATRRAAAPSTRWAGASRFPADIWDRLLPRRARRPALALASVALLAGGVAIGALSASGSSGGPGVARVISADVTIAGARAALHEDGGHNVLTVTGLPQPRVGHVYEVWVKHRGALPQPTSSLFAPTDSGVATVAVPSDLGAATEVMVTQEPAGGSALPTTSPVIVARVS